MDAHLDTELGATFERILVADVELQERDQTDPRIVEFHRVSFPIISVLCETVAGVEQDFNESANTETPWTVENMKDVLSLTLVDLMVLSLSILPDEIIFRVAGVPDDEWSEAERRQVINDAFYDLTVRDDKAIAASLIWFDDIAFWAENLFSVEELAEVA
jgi:hypothetical protein